MHELPRTIPDVRMLLALAPEELAATILFLLKNKERYKVSSRQSAERAMGTLHLWPAANIRSNMQTKGA
jgi:hypothetical protein